MVNKYDAFNKVRKVINSCKTWDQFIVALNMRDLFIEMYDDLFLEDHLFTCTVSKREELIDK